MTDLSSNSRFQKFGLLQNVSPLLVGQGCPDCMDAQRWSGRWGRLGMQHDFHLLPPLPGGMFTEDYSLCRQLLPAEDFL